MADGIVQIQEPASPTKKLDTTELIVGANTVERERMVVAGATDVALAVVGNATPGASDYGLVVREVVQPVVGGGVEATAQRVTIASDSTGVLSVDDNGASLTVDNPTISVVGGGAEATAQRVTLASDSTGVLTVKQATAANLNATVVGTGTLAVQDSQVIADNAGFTDGTSKVLMAGYAYDEVAGTALTENDAVAARVDVKRAQVMVVEDATTRGQRQGVTAGGAAKADITTIAGTAPTTVGKLDVKAADGDVFVRQATAANLNAQVVGEVAHDGVDSGNPQKMGAQARQTNPTAVADADRVNLIADDVGRQVVRLGQVRDLMVDATTTITVSTETTILAAVASTFLDLVTLIIANTSATGVRVDIRDTTAGTVLLSLYAPATQTVGFTLTRPKNQTTVNTNWTAQASSAVTDLRVYVQAEKNI